MYEIRIHGIGGEGVVKLSEIIGKAATQSGKWAHSFPFFGTEIRGAAVKAFTRVDDNPITIKSYIYEPDVVIITNDILLNDQAVIQGIKPDSWLLINTTIPKEELEKAYGCKVFTINATSLGYEIIGKPIVNTILLGVLIGATEVVSFDSAMEIISEEFGEKIARLNIEAARRGYDEMKKVMA